MKEYNVIAVAEELMFTTSEYKEIVDIYFEEMDGLLESCESAMQSMDYITVGQVMHAIKGASSNLRIYKITEFATEAEKIVKQGGGAEVAPYLPKLAAELNVFKEYVEKFFAENAASS